MFDLYNDNEFGRNYTVIFHFAAIVGVENVINNPYLTLSKNILLTDIAIKIAKALKILINLFLLQLVRSIQAP